jgi:hypothetical protein
MVQIILNECFVVEINYKIWRRQGFCNPSLSILSILPAHPLLFAFNSAKPEEV